MNTPTSFTKIPISEVIKTPDKDGFYELRTNRYYAVTDDDCILRYGDFSIQCNSDRRIADKFVANPNHPSAKTLFIKKVFLPHDCKDY